jgi:hypothetical protein
MAQGDVLLVRLRDSTSQNRTPELQVLGVRW